MSLIYCVETDLYTLQKVHILVLLQTLRSQIQQLGPACQHIVLYRIDLTPTQTRVDEMCHTLFFRVVSHGVNLVLHQRNQRRDNNCHSVHDQGWQLETQTLSATRRHEHKSVFPLDNITDDGFLIAFERVKPEISLQRIY